VEIILIKSKQVLANRVKIADTFGSRLIGLLFHNHLHPMECLIIVPCCSIHTFGMRFSIDVLFLNKEKEVLSSLSNFPPNRISPTVKNAYYVIEIVCGSINQLGIAITDSLLFVD
jgi:uncharacterized membrane protein (UPF0127 family)